MCGLPVFKTFSLYLIKGKIFEKNAIEHKIQGY
jgi:hypothetical protein